MSIIDYGYGCGITLGSLFDGIGGFPLAATRHGITPIWASEIDKNCIEITKRHFPKMVHLGDIEKINGAEVTPVDIITFGSPCQDLSVAGRREGLGGKRSGLFLHAIRIIRQMRNATNGKYPRFAVWENVPGAFSSNGGRDFRTVLEEFTETEISVPGSNKWSTDGMVRGDGCEVSWRVLDAQLWGVPQRRKRIFLVADFRGECAGEILFKPEGLRGDFTKGGSEREGTTRDITDCTGITIWFKANASIADNAPVITERIPPLQTTSQMAVCFGIGGQGDIGHALRVEPSKADKPRSTAYIVHPQVTGTLCASGAGLNRPAGQGNELDLVVAMPIVHAVLANDKTVTGTILANCGEKQWLGNQEAFSGDYSIIDNYKVRRLTPLECERLQGFPDGWTEGLSDTQRYKALGNSLAIPCVEYVMEGIADVMEDGRND